MWIFCGYVVTTGTFDDGDRKGQGWTSVKSLIGKLRRPEDENDERCTKCVLAKCAAGFVVPPVGARGLANFDEYGRLSSFICGGDCND